MRTTTRKKMMMEMMATVKMMRMSVLLRLNEMNTIMGFATLRRNKIKTSTSTFHQILKTQITNILPKDLELNQSSRYHILFQLGLLVRPENQKIVTKLR
jgi:hypothetical protein